MKLVRDQNITEKFQIYINESENLGILTKVSNLSFNSVKDQKFFFVKFC
jgi:hypothetical protein